MHYPLKLSPMVAEFYDSDEVSRVMPGKKDFVSVRVGANRIHVQKRLVLSNLKETYRLFKEKFPAKTQNLQNYGQSTAIWLEPVVLTVCVFALSIKLMMIGGNINY